MANHSKSRCIVKNLSLFSLAKYPVACDRGIMNAGLTKIFTECYGTRWASVVRHPLLEGFIYE